MPHHAQPQGVARTLDLSVVPDSGFLTNEFKDSQNIVIPSHLTLTGNPSAPLVFNPAHLRTHTDQMILQTSTTGELTLIIAKQPFNDYQTAQNEPDKYIAHTFNLTFDGTPKRFALTQVDGAYALYEMTSIAPV